MCIHTHNTNTWTRGKIDNSTHRERELAITVGIKLFEDGRNCPAHAYKQSLLLAQAAFLRSSKNVSDANGCCSALFAKPGRGKSHLEVYNTDCCMRRKAWLPQHQIPLEDAWSPCVCKIVVQTYQCEADVNVRKAKESRNPEAKVQLICM